MPTLARSLRGLDGINLMADVRDGVGPYLAVFFKGQEHWDAGAIGVAMAASKLSAAARQISAGLLVDATRAKRLLIALHPQFLAAGIFGVIAVLIASDLTRGTGRFNLAQGLVALSVGVGAALSNASAGYIVQAFGYPTGFLSLTGIAGAALAFFALRMPETCGEKA